jgi:NitT/TauT family transport system substrate-binding protein
MSDRREHWSRRTFVGRLTVAGTAGLLGLRPKDAAAEPPPETTRIRLLKFPGICIAPQYVAEELLKAEGFSHVEYIPKPASEFSTTLAAGALDIGVWYGAPLLIQVDQGDPVTILSGVHVGCFELFASERIRSIRDLKGKTVGVSGLGLTAHVFVTLMVAHVGLDPRKDVNWIVVPAAEAKKLFVEGKADAYLAFPPETRELRERKIGHVIVNSALDRPWSNYFCCMAVANQSFVRNHPVATKRALRAILKAADMCALEPERTAVFLVERGFTARRDFAIQSLKAVPYDKWREYDHDDALRFWALRLHEAAMVKSNPRKILAQGTDWRFLNELKKELKG